MEKLSLRPASASTSRKGYKSGFIALIGRPNTGKSTLANSLVKYPVSITANKPQTTRNNIRGIVTTDRYQAILVDTPGIHEPVNTLHNRIVNYALETIKEADIVMMIAEPVTRGEELKEDDMRVIEALQKARGPVFLIMNKIDLYQTERMMKNTQMFIDRYPFKSVFPISALKKKGLDRLEKIFTDFLPPGEPLYPGDAVTDSSTRDMISEIVRESVYRFTSKEIPYSCAVDVEKIDDYPGLCRIYASVIVGRHSHKKIVIGRQGSAVKRIGVRSRKKIQMILLKTVYLDLNVKVIDRWYDNDRRLTSLGYS